MQLKIVPAKLTILIRILQNLPSDTDLIIGEARSECSIAIAEATKNKNIPQMSYASTSAELSDKQTYPNFFRTCASDVFQSQALAKLVQRYKWSRVSTITTSDSHNDDLALKFAKEVRRAGVDITTEQRFEAHTKSSIKENLKEVYIFVVVATVVVRKRILIDYLGNLLSSSLSQLTPSKRHGNEVASGVFNVLYQLGEKLIQLFSSG